MFNYMVLLGIWCKVSIKLDHELKNTQVLVMKC